MQPVRKEGHTANLERLLATSPATLAGFGALRAALEDGSLTPQMRACIGLVVAEANGCEYSLACNVARAHHAGLDDETIAEARQARSANAAVHAVLAFAEGLVYAHGRVSIAETERLRDAGYTKGDIVEIIATVTLSLAENYFALATRLRPPDGAERVCPLYERDEGTQRGPV